MEPALDEGGGWTGAVLRARRRDVAIDVAKAIAIMAIVLGHVWRGLEAADLIGDPALFQKVDDTLYLWHLSVFAFAAGLFVQPGMRRDGAWPYASSRLVDFLWLYALWTIIQGCTKVAAASLVNNQTSFRPILSLWTPLDQFWFFGWIALMLVLAALLVPWTSTARARWAIAGSAVVSIAVWGLNGPFLGLHGLGLTVYFAVGLLLTHDGLRRAWRRFGRFALLGCAVGGAAVVVVVVHLGVTPPTWGGADRTAASVALGFVGSTAGLVAVLAVSKCVAPARLAPAVGRLGSESMSVFVAHIVFTSSTRIVLEEVGIGSLAVHVVAGTAAGVIGPMVLVAIAPRLRMGWLFSAPAWLEATLGVRRRPT